MHEERLQAEVQQKLLLEEAKRREAEALVHDMEASEEVLIERLRRTQEAQKLAYEELEQALSMLSARDVEVRELVREPLYPAPPASARGMPIDSARLLMAPAPPPRASSVPATPRSPRTASLAMYSGSLLPVNGAKTHSR